MLTSCGRVRLSLTPTAWGVQSRPHKAEPVGWVQDLSRSLSVQPLFALNRVWTWTVAGRGSGCRAIRCQGAVSVAGWVMMDWRRWGMMLMLMTMVIVEQVFSQLLVIKGGVPREVVGQGGSLRLDWSQTLILALRSENTESNKSSDVKRTSGDFLSKNQMRYIYCPSFTIEKKNKMYKLR